MIFPLGGLRGLNFSAMSPERDVAYLRLAGIFTLFCVNLFQDKTKWWTNKKSAITTAEKWNDLFCF